MPRAPNERPARRLDAILDTLRRHGVRTFKATDLPGIGNGIEFTFAPAAPVLEEPAAPPPARNRFEREDREPPIDELDLVAEGREGPIPS